MIILVLHSHTKKYLGKITGDQIAHSSFPASPVLKDWLKNSALLVEFKKQ